MLSLKFRNVHVLVVQKIAKQPFSSEKQKKIWSFFFALENKKKTKKTMLERFQKLLAVAQNGALAHELYKKDYKFQSSRDCISILAVVCIFIVLFVILALMYWKLF